LRRVVLLFWEEIPMKTERSTTPLLLSLMVVLSLIVGACGSNGEGDESNTDTTAVSADDNGQSGNDESSESTAGDDTAGDDPVGTATIDGTDYTVVASLQCLVALDQANQISISGDVVEYESDSPVEWNYAWDSDDGVNEFSLRVGDDRDEEYSAMDGLSEPEVNGESVTASGAVQLDGESFDASFTIDCDS
jgi:hypothetical protein